MGRNIAIDIRRRIISIKRKETSDGTIISITTEIHDDKTAIKRTPVLLNKTRTTLLYMRRMLNPHPANR